MVRLPGCAVVRVLEQLLALGSTHTAEVQVLA